MPGPPPPDPPEYGPHKPVRARDVTPAKALPATPHASAETVQLLVEEVLTRIKERDEQSDIRHQEDSGLKQDFLEWRQQQAKEKREREKRRSKWKKIGGALGAVLAGVVGAWQGYAAMHPKPPQVEAEDVKKTVEERTTVLESAVDRNTDNVTELQRNVEHLADTAVRQEEQQLDGFKYLGDKIDKAHPRAEAVEPPDTIREGVEKLERKREAERKRQKRDHVLNGETFGE